MRDSRGNSDAWFTGAPKLLSPVSQSRCAPSTHPAPPRDHRPNLFEEDVGITGRIYFRGGAAVFRQSVARLETFRVARDPLRAAARFLRWTSGLPIARSPQVGVPQATCRERRSSYRLILTTRLPSPRPCDLKDLSCRPSVSSPCAYEAELAQNA
jgi:hypothetical protein